MLCVLEFGQNGSDMRVATYNVHSCRGADGVSDPERIAAVLEELQADLVGLQEIESHRRRVPDMNQFAYFAGLAGWHFTPGLAIEEGRGRYGNGLLSRERPTAAVVHDISAVGLEPRSVLEVAVAGLTVLVSHLSLSPPARARQIRFLAGLAGDRRAVVLADFNEWNPLSRSFRPLAGLKQPATGPTYPARFPLLRLDRIYGVRRAWVHGSPLARRASDHLPVLGEL